MSASKKPGHLGGYSGSSAAAASASSASGGSGGGSRRNNKGSKKGGNDAIHLLNWHYETKFVEEEVPASHYRTTSRKYRSSISSFKQSL
jgi:hypothetical protein